VQGRDLPLGNAARPQPAEKALRVAHARVSGADWHSQPPKNRALFGASRNARRGNVRQASSFPRATAR
jgi:hypothetical protein